VKAAREEIERVLIKVSPRREVWQYQQAVVLHKSNALSCPLSSVWPLWRVCSRFFYGVPNHVVWIKVSAIALRGERGGSRSRATLRLLTPPLQRRTHRIHPAVAARLKRRRHSAARSTCARLPPTCAPRHSAPTRCASPGAALPTCALHARAGGLDAADASFAV
jgi:hypothetical protein